MCLPECVVDTLAVIMGAIQDILNYKSICIESVSNIYPIDTSVILEQLQIKCYYTDIENNADGKYCRKENQILVNKSQKGNSGLVRIILVHELGHCIYNHDGALFSGKDIAYSKT